VTHYTPYFVCIHFAHSCVMQYLIAVACFAWGVINVCLTAPRTLVERDFFYYYYSTSAYRRINGGISNQPGYGGTSARRSQRPMWQ